MSREFVRLTVRVEPWMADKIREWAKDMGLAPGEFYRLSIAVGAHRLRKQWGSLDELPQELVIALMDLMEHLLRERSVEVESPF